MNEPVAPLVQSHDVTELETLRRTNTELLQKAATRKAKITELEASIGKLTTAKSDAEARIKALTIDAPVNELCESISVAPRALRSALESEYKIEIREGVLTLLNPTDGKPVIQDGKAVPFTAESIKALLLGSKDEANRKLYNAIIIANKASGSGGETTAQRGTGAPSKPQFGLGMSMR
jgi:hypothetical protein